MLFVTGGDGLELVIMNTYTPLACVLCCCYASVANTATSDTTVPAFIF